MIVLSFLLVIVAAVTLVIGLFVGENLIWIWTSIGSCVVAMIFLGIGVLQRRSAQPADAGSGSGADSGYGPGSISGLLRDDTDEQEETDTADDDVTVVPKRTVDEVPDSQPAPVAGSREGAESTSAETGDEAPVAATLEDVSETPTSQPAPSTTAAPVSDDETVGDAARERLSQVKGLGRAKQDALLDRFGSLEGIQGASIKELRGVKGFGDSTARSVHQQLAASDGGLDATPAVPKKTTGKAARERLAEIKGLGPAKQKVLLKTFGSLEAIGDASVAELESIKGIGATTAEEIRRQLG